MYLVLYEWAPTGGYEGRFDWSVERQAPPPAAETPPSSRRTSVCLSLLSGEHRPPVVSPGYNFFTTITTDYYI